MSTSLRNLCYNHSERQIKKINFSKACCEISESLLQIVEPTKNQAKSEIKRVCSKYSLDRIPKNYEILATVNGRSYENSKMFC